MHTCRPTSGNRHGVLIDSGGPTRHIREFSSSGFTQRNSFSRLEWAWDGGRWVYLKGIPSPGSGSVHTPSTTPSYPGSDISWSQSRGRARGDEKMSRRVQRVSYHLVTKGIRSLPPADVRMILRGADDLIMRGGRHLLTLILKGSRAKDVLTRSLDESPAHGFYKNLPAEEVQARVDWVIRQGYLAIEYDYRLPLLIYTPKGWSIEKETMANEHLRHIDQALRSSRQPPNMSDLKDRNREVIWRLLEKIEASGDLRYIPALEAWEPIDYRKVRARIRSVIRTLRGENDAADSIVEQPDRSNHERDEHPHA